MSNADWQKLLHKKELTRKEFLTLTALAVISTFGVVGVIRELLSHAATPYTAGDAEEGARSGTTNLITGSTGAGSSEVVQFGTVSVSTSPVPQAPSSLGVSGYKLVFRDEFNTGTLNTQIWGVVNGSVDNGTTMLSSNVSFGSNGIQLKNTGNSGALVTSGTWFGGQSGSGWTCNPTGGGILGSSGPLYIEFSAYIPPTSNGGVAYWPALWLVGSNWPVDGEIDVFEGLGGANAIDIHYGSNNSDVRINLSGSAAAGGTHVYGVLWTTSNLVFVVDGVNVGTANVTAAQMNNSPQCLLLENGGQSPAPATNPAVMTVRYVRVWQG
jgi:hypothetical protein